MTKVLNGLHSMEFIILNSSDSLEHLAMLSLSDNNQTDVVEAFTSTSRKLDDLLNIDNPYFSQMVSQIYPTEL